ncbi:hypothetical protein AZKH_p0441 (plasmid) [Azoarcus sp. KH32C]|nr:hypothetical protein AZKH_p0441 [Azoarcus sp. KH32C]
MKTIVATAFSGQYATKRAASWRNQAGREAASGGIAESVGIGGEDSIKDRPTARNAAESM